MHASALRVLYVTSCWPYDKSYGGQMRAFHIGQALQRFGRPTIVLVGANEVSPDVVAKTAEHYDIGRVIRLERSPVRGVAARGASIFDPDFTNIHGMVANPQDEAWLVEAQKQFDLTWFFKLRTANYLAQARWPRAVVDVDDLPTMAERSAMINAPNTVAWAKSRMRVFELRRHERRLDRRFDVLSVCSEQDRATLGMGRHVHVIPNGVAAPKTPPPRCPVNPPRIGFMGLFSYEPNLQGVRWFVKHCWEQIKAQIPGVRLRLVGQDTDGPLCPRDAAIDGLGWVEKPEDEVASWAMTIVPIQFGAGTRVKIADAFSRKCPVVSTGFGALGYAVTSGNELLLADEPRAFADACVSLIRDAVAAEKMAERAYDRFLKNWSWEAITPRVWDAAEDCLRINYRRANR